jgi:hypothetical protein
MTHDALRRPRPEKRAWAVAFALFAVAAGSEVLGSLTGWNPTLARLYYLTGAVLVVGFLALGELYLLAPAGMARFGPGVTLLVTAAAATLVWSAGVDRARLADDGWDALHRGPVLSGLAIGINSLGTLVLVGGMVASAIRFKRLGIQRDRMIGCLLIAVGTIVVATGGVATRLGHHEYLYIPMAIGIAVIFAGCVQSRKPAMAVSPPIQVASDAGRKVPAKSNGHASAPTPAVASRPDPGIEFIEERLATLSAVEISTLCESWSVAWQGRDEFSRDEARRAWSLRTYLSPAARARFDDLPLPVQRQLSELYHEVMIAPVRWG